MWNSKPKKKDCKCRRTTKGNPKYGHGCCYHSGRVRAAVEERIKGKQQLRNYEDDYMIDALSMEFVAMGKEPHASHKMGAWESTLVSCASNDRFGKIRECENCGGRDVIAGGAGSRYHDKELGMVCFDNDEALLQIAQEAEDELNEKGADNMKEWK